MSRYVDMDKCPCLNGCKHFQKCGEDIIHPYCKRYEEWMKGEDVAPVRHGHWVDLFPTSKLEFKRFECSKCGVSRPNQYKYCPHCGAQMFDEVSK